MGGPLGAARRAGTSGSPIVEEDLLSPWVVRAVESSSPSGRNVVGEADALRLRILNAALLVGVVLGGLSFVRELVDSTDVQAWGVAVAAVLVYGSLVILLLAGTLPYRLRAFGMLAVLFGAGVYGLLAAGYVPAPILFLISENVLASVLFGRRATWVAFGLNLVALLIVGALLSSGTATLQTTTFYDPTDLIDWLRVTAVFAVFSGIAVVSVDVLTRHLDESLREQTELIENLKGAMQLHEDAERHRREAETRLREATGTMKIPGRKAETPERRLASIAEKAKALRTAALDAAEVQRIAADIEDTARLPETSEND